MATAEVDQPLRLRFLSRGQKCDEIGKRGHEAGAPPAQESAVESRDSP